MKAKMLVKIIQVTAAIATVGLMSYGCTPKSITSSSTTTSATAVTTTSTSLTTTVSTSTTDLALLQQYKNLGVSFHAIVTFNINNTNASYPSDFTVPQVPITWNGLGFSGRLLESGPGEDITDEMTGTVTADGKTLASLVYSRQILRTTGSGTYFNITFQAVPVNITIDSTGSFSFTGAAVQSYVTGINYADGPVVSGQVTASTSYVSTDWASSQQPPNLLLTFGK